MVSVTTKGNFSNTFNFLKKMQKRRYLSALSKLAQQGVDALAAATPVDTGKTAASWSYEIVETDDGASIYWTNSNENNGVNIALILQQGHGTRNGGYVQGRDYINPAIQPLFDQIAENAWKEVSGG